jgi:hypothetical protein
MSLNVHALSPTRRALLGPAAARTSATPDPRAQGRHCGAERRTGLFTRHRPACRPSAGAPAGNLTAHTAPSTRPPSSDPR